MAYNSIIKVKNVSNSFDTIFPVTKAQNIIVDEGTDKRLTSVLSEINSALAAKLDETIKGVPNGLATLDANGFVPLAQLPPQVKELKVVSDIAARDAITTKYSGLSVFVQDATDDETVNSGGAFYIYNGSEWVKVSEAESLDVVLDWNEIINKPTTLGGFGITDAVNIADVSDTAAPNKIIKANSEGILPASITGNAATATKLANGKQIAVTGDVAGSAIFDGSANIEIEVDLSNTGVTSGTYTKVTVDDKGRVTAGDALTANDIPALDWSKITTGKPTTLDGYGITDGLSKTGGTMTGFLTLSEDPTNPLHAATKQYVDNAVQGLDAKLSVRAATTGNISLNGIQVVDGVQLKAGDRVLVKDQTNAVENGIYVVSEDAWARAVDFDGTPSNEVEGGEYVFVSEGTVNDDSGWVVVTDAPITVGVGEIVFTQFSGAGQVIAGIGLTKNGNTLSLTNTGIVAGTYIKVTVDAQGRITTGSALIADDIPALDWSKITTGKPTSSVSDIDEAVTMRHTHANKSTLDLFGLVDGRIAYNGEQLALKNEANNTVVGSEEPTDLPVNGIWFQTV